MMVVMAVKGAQSVIQVSRKCGNQFTPMSKRLTQTQPINWPRTVVGNCIAVLQTLNSNHSHTYTKSLTITHQCIQTVSTYINALVQKDAKYNNTISCVKKDTAVCPDTYA